MVVRNVKNPIITPNLIESNNDNVKVVATLNPGVTIFKEKTLLLVRVAEQVKSLNDDFFRVPVFNNGQIEYLKFNMNDSDIDFSDTRLIVSNKNKYLTSMSYLLPAISEDGINFEFLYNGKLCAKNEYEAFGIEDSRITRIENDYYITYASASKLGVSTSLVKTNDFLNYQDLGVILTADNKDVAIFPKKINGKYYMIHRPSYSEFGKPEIWIAESENLVHWGNHRHLFGVREGKWDSQRVGSSSVPFLTNRGWLMIYHGADDSSRYCLGACLLDANEPWKVVSRTKLPIMQPQTDYETKGFFGNVVFSCGNNVIGDNMNIYYGAADKYICLATIKISDILKVL